MNRYAFGFGLSLALATAAIVGTTTTPAVAQEAAPDPKAVEKIDQFLKICVETPTLEEAAKKVVAANLVHVSMLDKNDKTKLNADKMRFSFKKAYENAKFYETKITRIQKTSVTAIGFKETAQKGTLFKYWVAKKEGQAGLPAPVQVFFPEGGGEPVLNDFGSF
jgi:hypothetical protein